MHFAFVLDRYIPEVDANVNCVNNIIKVLQKQGHKVSVVCGTSAQSQTVLLDDVRVYRVRNISFIERYDSLKTKPAKLLAKFLHFVHSVLVLPFFPNTELAFAKRLYCKLEDLNRDFKVDCAISVFRPFASVKAVTKFKKQHPNITAVAYYLDVLKGGVKPFGIPTGIYESMCDKREAAVFKKYDLVLMAQNGRRFYEASSLFADVNMKYVNFPTLVIKDTQEHKAVDNSKQTFVYAGYLDKYYRNPIPMFEVFKLLKSDNPDIQLHIYGTSNMNDEILQYEKENSDLIFYHGKVAKQVADDANASANCIISFGNATAGVVPSKIFEVIATKKKVLHFSPSKDDSSLEYLEKYPNCCIIDVNNSLNDNCDRIREFISCPAKEISNDYMKREFASALPETVSDFILREVGPELE